MGIGGRRWEEENSNGVGEGVGSEEGSSSQRWMSWRGFVENRGGWEGRRGLYNGQGLELLDLSSSAVVEGIGGGGEGGLPGKVKWRTEAYREGGDVEVEDVEWTRREVELYGAAVADGSFSIGPRVVAGESFKVEQCALAGDFRIRSSHAYDWEGRMSGLIIARERRREAVQQSILPSAWRSSSALFDYLLGTWEGSGNMIHRFSGRSVPVSSNLRLNFNLNGDPTQTSSLSVIGGPSRKVQATATRDGCMLLFAKAGVQMLLLPGGVSVAGPIAIIRGEPFVIELGFLVRPDERLRIARCYNSEGQWMNTVFLQERRVAVLQQ